MTSEQAAAWIAVLTIVVRWLHLEAKTIYALGAWSWTKIYMAGQFLVAQGGFFTLYFRLLGATEHSEKMACVIVPGFILAALAIFFFGYLQ